MASMNDQTKVLMEKIIEVGSQAYNPDSPLENRRTEVTKFKDLLAKTTIRDLMPTLTTLIQTGRVHPWLRPHLIRTLSLLPLRPRGVRHTIEFVISVHPSTLQHAEQSQEKIAETRGPIISPEALSSASRLISSPPSSMSAKEWFDGIAPQLVELLDGQGGLEMIKVSAYIIGFGILGRREYGAPGAPGWNAIMAPILSSIDPSTGSPSTPNIPPIPPLTAGIETLTKRNVIVSALELADALRRLVSLVSSHPNPALSKRILGGMLLPLWSLTSWIVADGPQEQWRAPAQYLLLVLLRLADSTALIKIVENLMFQGSHDPSRICWTYRLAPSGGIEIEKWSGDDDGLFGRNGPDLAALDGKVDAFINLLQHIEETDSIPALFLFLCKKWLLSKQDEQRQKISLLAISDESEGNMEIRIVEAKLLQGMIDQFPDRLVSKSSQVLELAMEVLHRVIATNEDLDLDDTVAIALSLLNMVFMSSSFQTKTMDQETSKSIQQSLASIASRSEPTVSSTAQNLLLLLNFQITNPSPDQRLKPTSQEDKPAEDRKTYNLAMSYLTAADSLTPVKAQGLDLLSTLIISRSPVLDIPAIIILLTTILQDDEEYIYLRTIKAFISLSDAHPKAVLRPLLETYLDATEESTLNQRLRTGEALLQVIERAGQSFSGDIATHVGSGLLFLASRRGYRPRTEEKQRRDATLQKKATKEAEEAWGGPVPDLEDELTEEETANQAYLASIVGGWESRRGSEDVRIRASALSIFGTVIETNAAGLGTILISSAIDLCINLLALEPEAEKAILRRAAILLVMSLIRALDHAHDEGRKLGFGFAGKSLDDILRILKYVAETDNDGLVRQHAGDVIEGLETWQLKSLMPSQGGQITAQTELTELAGLAIQPEQQDRLRSQPKIEEIE